MRTPDCYGRIDLYGDDVLYDGKTGEGHGPLPYEPDDIATPYHLTAAWNGGEKPCTPATSDSPTPSQSAPATPSTPAADQPPAEASTPPAPTPKSSSTPTTTPDVPPLTSTPSATPTPWPSDSKSPLAETGGDLNARAAPSGIAEIDQVARTHNEMLHSLSELLRRESDFTANASHRLHTPSPVPS